MPLVQLDELELYYQRFTNGDRTVLALHPSTVPGNMFKWALPRIDGFDVLLPDQRGHGKTANPSEQFHMSILVQDMLTFIEAMELRTFHAIGYSMGGTVLLNIAAKYPQYFESLVMIGGNYRPPTQDEFEQVAGPLNQRTGLTYEIMHPERGLQNGWLIELDDLRSIMCPTVLVSGDRDPISNLEDALAMYRILPEGRLLVVPHCAHFGYHTNEMVKTFLSSWYESRLAADSLFP